MAVTNTMLMAELKRLQARVDELGASIALLCERAAGLETWRNGHDANVHTNLREQLKALAGAQVRQGDRLWRVALQAAEVTALLAATTKMMNIW